VTRTDLSTRRELGPFDALVTDLMMPLMAGDELARRLRLKRPELESPVSDRLHRAAVQGEDDAVADEAFLEKPCTMKGLRERFAAALPAASISHRTPA